MDINKMKRTDLIQFIESVKAGKIQLTSNIWKLQAGIFYCLKGNDWTPEPEPVFSDADTLICDAEPPLNYTGQVIGVGKPNNQIQALKDFGLTDSEIEAIVKKSPTVESVANEIVKFINKMQNE